MAKSTLILGVVCLALAVAFVVVLWRLTLGAPLAPSVHGSLNLGWPIVERHEAQPQTIASPSALLWDAEAHVIRFEKGGFERRPIASLTKLMMAMVAFDLGIPWDKEVEILPQENVVGGRLMVFAGERVTMRDLWHASLLGSANNATLALVRNLAASEREFVQAMNRKAIELGLEQTEFVDVTGLDPDNVSTAYEVVRMAEAAWRDYPDIARTTAVPEYRFTVSNGREHTIKNTNKLITERGMALTGSKTGYLYEANFCLVAQGAGMQSGLVASVLGSPSEWDSMQDVQTLLQLGNGGV